jgi:hypothetical protein
LTKSVNVRFNTQAETIEKQSERAYGTQVAAYPPRLHENGFHGPT